jgi:hypothetical protein
LWHLTHYPFEIKVNQLKTELDALKKELRVQKEQNEDAEDISYSLQNQVNWLFMYHVHVP